MVDRASHKDPYGGNAFTAPMESMLEFYEALYADLPPAVVKLGASDKARVIVYTDASSGDGYHGLGIVVLDLEDGARYVSGDTCPTWLLEKLSSDHQVFIAQLELYVTLCALRTFGRVLQGRDVVWFVDSTHAMSPLVHGYARAPDMAAMSNIFHLRNAKLRARVWLAWVPSNANISDVPSRPDDAKGRELLRRFAGKWRRMRHPPGSDWPEPGSILR